MFVDGSLPLGYAGETSFKLSALPPNSLFAGYSSPASINTQPRERYLKDGGGSARVELST
jgi:hypothetical protein